MWSLDIETELSLIYRPRSTLIDWGLVTPIWWQNSCHHWLRYWLVIILVPTIAWTNDDILSIGTLETNLCEIILQIQIVCVVIICWKMLSAKQWPFCSGLDVLTHNKKVTNLVFSQGIMGTMMSQITSLTIVYSTVYSGADQRKHQRSASVAFARGFHRWPVNSPHKGPAMRKIFPFDDFIMFDPYIWERVVSLSNNWVPQPPTPTSTPTPTALVPVKFPEMQRSKLQVSPKHKETQAMSIYLGIYRIALFWILNSFGRYIWLNIHVVVFVFVFVFESMYLYLYLYLNQSWRKYLYLYLKNPNFCICICIW